VNIAQTLDRPGMWSTPYESFKEPREGAGREPRPTVEAIRKIREVFTRIEGFKAQSSIFAGLVKHEIAQKAHSPGAEETFGAMLNLLYARLTQMQG
jgi:hypothetical protein